MRALRFTVSSILAVCWASGCIIDTVPTPENRGSDSGAGPVPSPADAGDLPGLAGGAVFYSPDGSGAALLLAGTSGAVPAAALVGVENLRTRSVARRTAAADGSFALFIDATPGDQLVITYWVSLVARGSTTLTVGPPAAAAIEIGPSGVQGTLSISTCGGGSACVSGAAGAATPGITVAVVNIAGAASAGVAAPDGSFSAKLLASSGDELMVFLVPPGSQSGGLPQILWVP